MINAEDFLSIAHQFNFLVMLGSDLEQIKEEPCISIAYAGAGTCEELSSVNIQVFIFLKLPQGPLLAAK